MIDPAIGLTTVERLLLSLCRLDFSGEQKAEIRSLVKEIRDWDQFTRLANNHGIIALTAFNIRETGLADLIPAEAMKSLDNGRMKSMVRNAWLVSRWKQVNKIMSDAGIKHILLKGMALEYTVYGAKGLRQMTDSDILVKKEDAMKAWLLLQKNGFVSDMIKSPLHRKIITDIGKHMPTLRKDDFPVEIHHRLFQDREKNKKLNEAIDNAIEIDIEGTRAFVLNDDIHLDYLEEHLNYHVISGGSQLRLFLDMELLKPGSAPHLTGRFLDDPDRSADSIYRKNAYRYNFCSLPEGIRFRYLAGDIFPSLMWMKKRYNCGSARALLYYPQRLGKLGWLMKGVKS